MLTAAVEVIDEGGLSACTMRAVAERLGVQAMSLYRHVGAKEAMLGLVPDHLLGPTATAVEEAEGALAALSAVASGLREVVTAHPQVAPLLAQPQQGPRMMAAAEHCVTLLGAEGVPPDEAFRIVRAVVAQVIGESVTRHGDFDVLGVELVLSGLRQRLPS